MFVRHDEDIWVLFKAHLDYRQFARRYGMINDKLTHRCNSMLILEKFTQSIYIIVIDERF